MKLDKQGKTIISITLILAALLLLIITNTTGDLTCWIEEASSCSSPGTILLYMQNDTGGWDNAHAENTSYVTYGTSYANILCCNSTNNTLDTFCGTGTTFLNLSNETNAHVEDTGYDNYTNGTCININSTAPAGMSLPNLTCSIELTGCPLTTTCLVSMASSEEDNKTNAHVASCDFYDTEVCCHMNTRPTVVDLNEPFNYSNFSTVPEFNWSNATDADNDAIYYILEVYSEGSSWSNLSIAETDNTTEYVWDVTGFTEGHWFWHVLATDLQDNASDWSEVRYFTFDQSPPTIIANHTVNNSKFCNRPGDTKCFTEINFTIQDYILSNTTQNEDLENVWWVNSSGGNIGVSEFAYQTVINSGYNIMVYSINVTDWPEGDVNITVWANDSSGNEQIAELSTFIDNSGPNITLVSPAGVQGNPAQTFKAIVSDASTIINCSLIIDNAINQTITSGIVNNSYVSFSTDLTDDVYEWTVNCTDEVNNEGTNESVYTVTIDTSNPIIFLDVGPSVLEFYLDNCSVNWSIEEVDLKTNYTNVTMPNGTDLSHDDNFTLSAQENLTILGNYTVTTHAEDGRGAASHSTNSTEFEVRDTIVPEVILVSPANGTIQNSSDITFSFNVSDYHSVDHCTLWLNETKGYDGYDNTTTIENNITITQNISKSSIVDDENIPWNVSCYDSSTNSNNFSNLSSDLSEIIHLIIDVDTTPPLIDFIDITELNNTYFSRNSTYINVSVTESHNDTVTIVWNYTTNCTPGFSTPGFNEVLATPGEGNVIFYEINITDLTEGVYEYYVFANDTLANESEGHDNISEVRTITIDETPPPAFNLLEPANNIETTDDTPTFNWEDSTDINLENYTLEIDDDEGFNTIFKTIDINTTDSYYALSESEVLGTGTWYWRVNATDKANNQRTSTSTFQFTIGNASLPTVYIMGPGGGGGGGGGKKVVYGVVDILQPSMQTLYEKETITTPVIIQNTGEGAIRGITLTATTNSPSVKLKLSKTYIAGLSSGQKEEVDLEITAEATVGEYEVVIKAEATDPKVTDQVKFYVNLVGFGLGKRTIMEEKLRFIGKLFESNPECLELREMVEEAKKKLEEKDYDKSLEIIESAIKSCEELVKTGKKKVLEKPAEPKKTLQILIGEIILFILVFIMIYRYYRRRKYKGPIMARKGKPGITIILIMLVFLSGFFLLKDYTGLTVFEDIPGSDSFGGDYSGTSLNVIDATVNLSEGVTIGNFTSRVFTANFTVEWQTINWSWASQVEGGDNVTMDIRTSLDNITWSSWSENVTNTSKIPDAKNIWTDEGDFIGTLTDTSITNQSGNITLGTSGSNYNETGNFTSTVLDLGFTDVNITTIEFTITNTSEEDNITIETSTSADNSSWEEWAQTNVSGDQVFSTDNRYFKWRATLVTNYTTVTPVLEDLTVNYERNSTYLQYRATLSTNDNTKTPALEWVNITYQDANLPLFGFLDPTPENGSSITDDFTYINFTVTEPNNDSFYLNWNGTQYNPIDMNETETVSEGTNVYALNITGLSESTTPSNFSLLNPPDNHRSTSAKPFFLWEDSTNTGIYEYYIWANDTYGHENQTENRTVTLSYNIDNYTLEIATSTDFNTTSITATYYSTSPNYQLNDSEALPDNGTYYWRVIPYNKAGNNYIINYYFTYHVGIAAPVAYAPGTMGEGGGGGKPVERRQSGIELIKPSALSFFANRQIIIPLLVVNTGTQILQGIELTAESADLELELKNNYFPILRPHQEIDPQLVVKPIEDPGRYNIVVKAKVADPEFTDAIMFMIDVTEFGFGNKTETEEKLTFVVDFIKSNDECAELEKAINDAKEAFKKNEFDLALSLAEQAVQNCKDLVSTAKEKKLEKRKRPTWQYYVPLLEVLLFLLIFSVVYSYYKRMKFKRRRYW